MDRPASVRPRPSPQWYACWFLAAAFDAAGLAGMTYGSDEPYSYWAVSSMLTAVCLEVGGLLMWRRWPGNPVGPLIYCVGLPGMAQYFVNFPHGAALAVGYTVAPLPAILVGHALLLYPDGRFHRRAEKVFVILAYVVALGIRVPNLLVSRTEWLSQCERRGDCVANPFLIQVNSPLAYDLDNAASVAVAALALGFVGMLAYRVRRGRVSVRRAFRPLVAIVGVLVVSFVLIQRNTWSLQHPEVFNIAAYAQMAASVALPVAMTYGLVRARPDLVDLIRRLEQVSPDRMEAELRAALADPTLRIVQSHGDGTPADPAQPGLAVTDIDVEKLLVHDPGLVHDRPLLDAVAAAARLALHKARLQAEVTAEARQAAQARASLVDAAQEERRRLERDLHDGAQQRLIGVGMSIEYARRYAGDPVTLDRALDDAATELRNSLTELRELSRGLRPALLAERGLAGAVPVLAQHTPVPVRCDLRVDARLPEHVEAAAYFVISEALQNVGKHAKASQVEVTVLLRSGRLRIEVVDDGVGGASPSDGSGLRGLAERLAALDGLLAIESPPGHGTTIAAEIPVPAEGTGPYAARR